MADYPVGSDPGIHGTVKYMEITTANPTIGYTYLDFVLAGLNRLHRFNRKAFISSVVCCFQKFLLSDLKRLVLALGEKLPSEQTDHRLKGTFCMAWEVSATIGTEHRFESLQSIFSREL